MTQPTPSTLLLCLDLESGSRELALYAAQLAKQCRYTIALLHVAVPKAKNLHWVRQRLDEIVQHDLAGVTLSMQRIEQGIPEDKIIETAGAEPIDLILLGRRKRPTVERIYVGSTTSAVLSLACKPVMVVPLIESHHPGKHQRM